MATDTLSKQNAKASRQDVSERFRRVRAFSEQLCEPLSPEDCTVQSMPDVSPTRWHLAHTTWFFETFLLSNLDGYRVFDPDFKYLFNSYYNAVGDQFPRSRRGLISRPSQQQIMEYRRHVDQALCKMLDGGAIDLPPAALSIVELGLNHEQQHQELILTDIKHVLSCNPLLPAYAQSSADNFGTAAAAEWLAFDEGVHWIGYAGENFAYDNESPRHRQFLDSFQFSSQPVTCGEYLRFMEEDGYSRPELWLSAGWQAVQEEKWRAPLYWQKQNGQWSLFTLAGLRPLNLDEPVCHVSYFEASAFASWSDARLPTEAEWEVAAGDLKVQGNFADILLAANAAIHPSRTAAVDSRPSRMFGDVWEWTASPYMPYPGYRSADGALGEYNGKFMCNQFVLRGGSCATSREHIRPTYRNFFPPEARWQFSGFRLARSKD